MWLERDFEPASSARNRTYGYRLLILDGHNSHTTYQFCNFGEKHKIIILCLPPHTTHRLQPCDVGIFGPVAQTWKAEVNIASREFFEIRKYNLIYHYSNARAKAFTVPTIQSAFRKTGIWPLDPDAIEPSAFAPALNTTTQAAQPVPAMVPDFVIATITPTPSAAQPLSATTSVASDNSTNSSVTTETTEFKLVLPKRLGARATREAIIAQNDELRYLLDKARYQMEKDYALKKLMELENERLRKRLYNKSNKPGKRQKTGFARHMTSEENLEALARDVWVSAMKEIFKDPVFKQQREKYNAWVKAQAEEAKEDAQKSAQKEREAERMRKDLEKFSKQQEKRREREKQKAVRDEAKQMKAAEVAARKAAKEAKAAAVKAWKAAAAKAGRRRQTTRSRTDVESEEEEDVIDGVNGLREADSGSPKILPPTPPREYARRPRPRPVRRTAAAVDGTNEAAEQEPGPESSIVVVEDGGIPVQGSTPTPHVPGTDQAPSLQLEALQPVRRSTRNRSNVVGQS